MVRSTIVHHIARKLEHYLDAMAVSSHFGEIEPLASS